jgi:hypothetical protein
LNNYSSTNYSSKSYGIAVSLCGIFGMVGIHHFYIGNYLHGIFDLSLLIFGVIFLLSGSSFYFSFGLLLLFIDFIHTFFIFYKLITEKQKDGFGKLIVISSGINA